MVLTKKVVLLGDSSVGKTSLIKRYVHDSFDDSYIVTIGTKVSKKELKVERDGSEERVKLMIWDVLGQTGFTSVHTRTFAGVHGAILVADVTRKETLTTLEQYWIPTLKAVVEKVPFVFAGNKADLKENYAFSLKDLQELASKYNTGTTEKLPPELSTSYLTSAKTGDNVDKLFESLGHLTVSEQAEADPIKELYESLLAMGVHRTSDTSTLTGTLDAIIVDFCEGINDDKKAMNVIRKVAKKIDLDVRNPTKEVMLKFVNGLAAADKEMISSARSKINKKKRTQMVLAASSDA